MQWARRLRTKATPFEKRLWTILSPLRRSHGLHVRRQAPIGPYVADFAIHARKLIIEVDGHTHEDVTDARRDAWFAGIGYRTIRISNERIAHEWEGVVREIEIQLGLCG